MIITANDPHECFFIILAYNTITKTYNIAPCKYCGREWGVIPFLC